MASSRWKRFAFFDRNYLTLPQPVIEDILPRQLFQDNNKQNASSLAAGANSRIGISSQSTSSIDIDEDVQYKGENISLAVTNVASLPIHITSILSEQDISKIDIDRPIRSMYKSLVACSNASSVEHNNKSENQLIHVSPSQQQQRDLITSTALTGTTSTCNTTTIEEKKEDSIANKIKGSLVLVFVSSKASPFVHCIDVTVRCTPINQISNDVSQEEHHHTLRNQHGTVHGRSANSLVEDSAGEEKVLEDLDGWRGFFYPFAHDVMMEESNTNSNSTTTTTTSSAAIAGATATAAATNTQNTTANNVATSSRASSATTSNMNTAGTALSPSSSASPSSASSSSSNMPKVIGVAMSSIPDEEIEGMNNIFVACITDSKSSVGISVHKNPHLYMNDAVTSNVRIRQEPNTCSNITPRSHVYQPAGIFDLKNRGRPQCVDITSSTGVVAVGTDTGMVIVYTFNPSSKANLKPGTNPVHKLSCIMEIPSPPTPSVNGSSVGGNVVTGLKLVTEKVSDNDTALSSPSRRRRRRNPNEKRTLVFVTYRRIHPVNDEIDDNANGSGADTPNKAAVSSSSSSSMVSSRACGGVCCYDLGVIGSSAAASVISPSARYDLDGRDVPSSCLYDGILSRRRSSEDSAQIDGGNQLLVGRNDGLYTFSSTDKVNVSPIDGEKIAICSIPPPPISRKRLYNRKLLAESSPLAPDALLQAVEGGATYVLVATTDSKSGRDAVDIYDATNKLVAFHLLLSPGHKALRASGITTLPYNISDSATRGGLSSAIVITSGGSVVTCTEKRTRDKCALLEQKNLFSAAVNMAFADPSFSASDISALYRRHAEHLYRKGDFNAAMDAFLHTIGTLDPSFVIFRFLDSAKIPMLVRYLEELRSRKLATSSHDELLKTCYVKLNDMSAAESISASLSKTMDTNSCISLVSNLLHNPTEAIATICSFDAPRAAEALMLHGATLARALPRETAGIVVSLVDGTFSPTAIADASSPSNISERRRINEELLNGSESNADRLIVCDMYPIHLFASAFVEHPKLLRLLLSYCNKNKKYVETSLKRALLELTLEEWKSAKQHKDVDLENLRRDEAISILSDPQFSDIGDNEALVIVQLAGFDEGEVMLYEKMQLTPMLLEKYAKDGSYKARRQMLAMCRSDPELLADVLGHFVSMASAKKTSVPTTTNTAASTAAINTAATTSNTNDDSNSVQSESDTAEIFDDIKEALSMARAQSILPPVRIVRILAGDQAGQFSHDKSSFVRSEKDGSVPLSVAFDYIGAVLDESSKDINRLKDDVLDYHQMCNSLEEEIKSLLAPPESESNTQTTSDTNSPYDDSKIEEMHLKMLQSSEKALTESLGTHSRTDDSSEEFWREMSQSEDRFDTIARFFAKGIID